MARPRGIALLSPRADRDIDQQFEYLAIAGGLALARRFLGQLRKTLHSLLDNPKQGSPRTLSDATLASMRVWPVQGFRRHLIYYLPAEKGINVIRILHAARDIERLFDEL
ncbi:MAG: type II toxin-antitoxin system RelE/ParE family toxin [Deltaproteobacteria bacterium]|nr:type II toxin-antitoxin system RelE/ParE family toxin [Deltaproteobacteria bacterium]